MITQYIIKVKHHELNKLLYTHIIPIGDQSVEPVPPETAPGPTGAVVVAPAPVLPVGQGPVRAVPDGQGLVRHFGLPPAHADEHGVALDPVALLEEFHFFLLLAADDDLLEAGHVVAAGVGRALQEQLGHVVVPVGGAHGRLNLGFWNKMKFEI